MPVVQVRALGAVVVGDEADDEERGQVAEVERGLDHARVAPEQAPCRLRQRQHRGVGDEPGSREHTARAECSEPGTGSRKEKAAEVVLLLAFDLFELDHRTAQRDPGDERAGAAEVLAGALAVLIAVHALDVDHRVAAFLARALLQRDHRAHKRDLAGFLVGLVGGVGLAIGGELAHPLFHRRRLLLAEVDADFGVDAVLGALCRAPFPH